MWVTGFFGIFGFSFGNEKLIMGFGAPDSALREALDVQVNLNGIHLKFQVTDTNPISAGTGLRSERETSWMFCNILTRRIGSHAAQHAHVCPVQWPARTRAAFVNSVHCSDQLVDAINSANAAILLNCISRKFKLVNPVTCPPVHLFRFSNLMRFNLSLAIVSENGLKFAYFEIKFAYFEVKFAWNVSHH